MRFYQWHEMYLLTYFQFLIYAFVIHFCIYAQEKVEMKTILIIFSHLPSCIDELKCKQQPR